MARTENQNGEGGWGGGRSERNAPTKRSSGHKKLNPFFMTEAEFKRTDGGSQSHVGARAGNFGSGTAVAKQDCKKLSFQTFHCFVCHQHTHKLR